MKLIDPQERELLGCPFCGVPLTVRKSGANPRAKCSTDGCFGAKLPVVNLDVPEDIAAWNRRAPSREEVVSRDAFNGLLERSRVAGKHNLYFMKPGDIDNALRPAHAPPSREEVGEQRPWRCQCGAYEWPRDVARITDAKGLNHNRNAPCMARPSPALKDNET